MSYSYKVFWKEDNKEKEGACFTALTTCGTVYSHFDIDETLTPEEVKFYLKFVAGFLDKKSYTAKVVKFDSCPFVHKNYVEYKEEVKEPIGRLLYSEIKFKTRKKALLHLTILRYLQEYPEIIKETFESKDKSKEDLYFAFYDNHKWKEGNKSDRLVHTFRYFYGTATRKPLSEVKKLIADDDLYRDVDSHF